MACEVAGFTIPEPVLAEIPNPSLHDIEIPAPPSLTLADEPVVNDDLASAILNFEYKEYASILNDLLGRNIESFFDLPMPAAVTELEQEIEKFRDDAAPGFLVERERLLNKSGAEGFWAMPGYNANQAVQLEMAWRKKLYDYLLKALTEYLEQGVAFIKFAFTAGLTDVKIAFDEKRNLVYANLRAVVEVARALLQQQKERAAIFDTKKREWQSALDVLNTYWQRDNIDAENRKYELEVQLFSMNGQSVQIDQAYMQGMVTVLSNSCVLLQAKEILTEATLEKLKTLQGQIILQGYLLRIKQVRLSLMEDRNSVKAKQIEVETYKKQIDLLSEQIRLVITQANDEIDKIDYEFKKRLNLLDQCTSNMRAQFQSKTIDEAQLKKMVAAYKNEVTEQAAELESILDLAIIDQETDVSEITLKYRKALEKYAKDIDVTRAKFSSFLSGRDSVTKTAIETCQRLKDAWADATADTCLRLTHEIGSE